MSFNAEEFLENPSIEELNNLKKDQLLEISKACNLTDTKSSDRKQTIRDSIVNYMVESELLPPSAKASVCDTNMSTLQLREVELKYELEKERILMEKERVIMEKEIRLKELEIAQNKQSSNGLTGGFDAAKFIRLVPRFTEKDVDKFFMHFEKVAKGMNWPEESWTVLLQSVFIGKARDTYSALPVESCNDYAVVKNAILKAYELVPEAYRQKFRNTRKSHDQTHVEFA